jgi:ligand-binding sensor protein
MSKRERESPMTLGGQINYKKQKSEEYVNAQKTADISTKQMLALVLTRIDKLDTELNQANAKIAKMTNIINNLRSTNTTQQFQIFSLCHHMGIQVSLPPNTQVSYIS